jgi:O-antigen/teichoic acid export membrane protein
MIGAAALSMTGQVAALATSLIATPIVIRLLGPAQYGLVALITTTLVYLGLAQLGMGMTSTRFASDALRRGDEQEEVAVVWTALLVTGVPLLILAAALWLLAGDVSTALHVPRHLHGAAVTGFRLAAVAALGRGAANVLNTPQLARLRFSTYVLVDSGSAVAQIAVTALVLIAWPSVVGAAAVLAAGALAAAGGQLYFSLRAQPRLLPPRLSRSLVRPILGFGGALIVSGLVTVPMYTAPQVLLAHFASIRAVAYYSVALSLATLLTVGPTALNQPLLPALTRTRGEPAEHARVYRLSLRLIALWVPPAAALLGFGARYVLAAFGGWRYADHSTVPFLIMLAGTVANVTIYPPSTLLEAHGRPNVIAKIRLGLLLPVLAISVWLVSTFGLIGAAVAWALRFPIEAAALSAYAWRVTGLSPGGLIGGGRAQLVALVILIAPPLALVIAGVPDAVVFAAAVPAAAAHLAYTWRRLLTATERGWAVELARSGAGRVSRRARRPASSRPSTTDLGPIASPARD